MIFGDLRRKHDDLIDRLKANNYSERYISDIDRLIKWILKHEQTEKWEKYEDIYKFLKDNGRSYVYIRTMRAILTLIERFVLYGQMPDGKHHCNVAKYSYDELTGEFKELIDEFRSYEYSARNVKEKTARNYSNVCAGFLCDMADLGAKNLSDINEDMIISYFTKENGEPRYSRTNSACLRAVFRSKMEWKSEERTRILHLIPSIKNSRKNIQYLKDDEISCLKETLLGNELSLRDKAITHLLYFTAIRACDVINLKLMDIDWEKQMIRITQSKTGVPLDIPMSVTVGNAMFDYLIQERPEGINCPYVFITKTKPYRQLTDLNPAINSVYEKAGIRQNPGDRKGTHLFRHHAVKKMLEENTPQPVISQTLGHSSPSSLDSYLNTDFKHLKECALDISKFPINWKEVLA